MSAAVTTREPRRALILAVVVAALVAGLVAGRSHVSSVGPPVVPVDASQRPNVGALSTAWYCPGLPASFPTADQTLTLSNVGPVDADAVVTVQPDNGAAPIVRLVTVPHDSVRTFDRASLAELSAPPSRAAVATGASLPPGPVIVEPFSPDVVVEAGAETANELDPVPCATTPATDWYFAAGTTVRGVSQWLILDDPYSTDARVDVTLRTDTGLQQLPGLQGIDVPGRSRVVVALHDQDVRQARVAVQVHADVGRVVAAQTLQFQAASGPSGLATSIGALAPSSQWRFTDGHTVAGASQWVAITDLSPLGVQVDVQAIVASRSIVSPVVLSVPTGVVSWVQIGGCTHLQTDCLAVPANTTFGLEAQADGNAPIVAQTLSRFGTARDALGATTSMGSTVPARSWVVARTRVIDERSTSISIMNNGISAAHVSVKVVSGGTVDRPPAFAAVTIAPNARDGLPADLAGTNNRQDAAVVISSDVPVFVESTISAQRDATRAPGIPSR
ncbi:MAG TPA: DUF5719 family protein [Acidimicrobiia bacterium]|nr:DUF5719 family protein [Acidimicrobiia bacterium]